MPGTPQSTWIDHIPTIWLEPHNPQPNRRLAIFLNGLSGDKQSLLPYLSDLAQAGFYALSFDNWEQGQRTSQTQAQASTLNVAGGAALFDLLEQDEQGRLKERIRAVMYRFFEQGKQEGYIEESLSFELLVLYVEIFQAGVQAKMEEFKAVFADPAAFEQLLHIYFYGVSRRQGAGGKDRRQ